jgi:hypothetical protein
MKLELLGPRMTFKKIPTTAQVPLYKLLEIRKFLMTWAITGIVSQSMKDFMSLGSVG